MRLIIWQHREKKKRKDVPAAKCWANISMIFQKPVLPQWY